MAFAYPPLPVKTADVSAERRPARSVFKRVAVNNAILADLSRWMIASALVFANIFV